MPQARADWTDTGILLLYFSHGTDGRQYFASAADYEGLGVNKMRRLKLVPPGRPAVKAQAITAWYWNHGRLRQGWNSAGAYELLLFRAFGVQVQLETVKETLSAADVRAYLTHVVLPGGSWVKSVRGYRMAQWRELSRARCVPPNRRPLLLVSLLDNVVGGHGLKQFEELFAETFCRAAELRPATRSPFAGGTTGDLKAMIASARVSGRTCNTLEDLFALGFRAFVHDLTFWWEGKWYKGVALVPKQTKASWELLLGRVFGKERVAEFVAREKQQTAAYIVANPESLGRYLEHGYIAETGGHRRLSTPEDYRREKLGDLVHYAYCQPPHSPRRRLFTLLEAAGGQRSEILGELLRRAFKE